MTILFSSKKLLLYMMKVNTDNTKKPLPDWHQHVISMECKLIKETYSKKVVEEVERAKVMKTCLAQYDH